MCRPNGTCRFTWTVPPTLAMAAATLLHIPLTAAAADLTVDPARVEAIVAMLPPEPAGVGRPLTDRAAWEPLAKRATFQTVLKDAEKLLTDPLPQTTDDLYLDYSRTGNRTHWEDLNFSRRGRLTTLVLAECLENKGRFLPAITTLIQSLCAERTWVLPAHDVGLTNFKGERITIDLGSSNLAWVLATADWLLGDLLDRETRRLIRDRVRERILEPFKAMATGRQRADNWITVRGNHNSVTLAGVTGAALALADSREERAFFVAAAEKYSRNYLDGFTPDGYCSEGIGYWNYGFGHYLMLAETILQATGGRVDLLTGENVRAPALFGTNIQIAPGICPAFADCDVNEQPSAHLQCYVSRKWKLGLSEVEPAGLAPPATCLSGWSPQGCVLFETALFAFDNSASQTQPASTPWAGLGPRSWFEQGGVLIGRPGVHEACRLAVALKGGHNGEQHNHNDVGSYVAVVGRQILLVDPGPEVYTGRTFSKRRYESKVLNSFGHPVPIVAGELQRAGRQARGRVVRTEFTDDADTLVLDMAAAYDVPALEKLERTFVYSRSGAGSLTVTDDVTFSSPQEFGTALITFGEWQKLARNRLRIEEGGEAVAVAILTTGGDIDVKADEIHEDVTAKRTPVHIGINMAKPVEKCRITLKIEPAGQ